MVHISCAFMTDHFFHFECLFAFSPFLLLSFIFFSSFIFYIFVDGTEKSVVHVRIPTKRKTPLYFAHPSNLCVYILYLTLLIGALFFLFPFNPSLLIRCHSCVRKKTFFFVFSHMVGYARSTVFIFVHNFLCQLCVYSHQHTTCNHSCVRVGFLSLWLYFPSEQKIYFFFNFIFSLS